MITKTTKYGQVEAKANQHDVSSSMENKKLTQAVDEFPNDNDNDNQT